MDEKGVDLKSRSPGAVAPRNTYLPLNVSGGSSGSLPCIMLISDCTNEKNEMARYDAAGPVPPAP